VKLPSVGVDIVGASGETTSIIHISVIVLMFPAPSVDAAVASSPSIGTGKSTQEYTHEAGTGSILHVAQLEVVTVTLVPGSAVQVIGVPLLGPLIVGVIGLTVSTIKFTIFPILVFPALSL